MSTNEGAQHPEGTAAHITTETRIPLTYREVCLASTDDIRHLLERATEDELKKYRSWSRRPQDKPISLNDYREYLEEVSNTIRDKPSTSQPPPPSQPPTFREILERKKKDAGKARTRIRRSGQAKKPESAVEPKRKHEVIDLTISPVKSKRRKSSLIHLGTIELSDSEDEKPQSKKLP
ncbi:hypothetical protein CPC08DRAFT_770047 [Agrocybe pediades]|nr:hypothetical protein CPC08DRAFT_770047 [Agrocybe pediades]